MDFPNQEEAKKLGYDIYSHSGDKSVVSYTKGQLCLTVYNGEEAELSSSYKMITLKTGKFSFPHELFHIFENQIMHLLNGVE